MRLRSIRVAAIHELPLQCVFLHQSYKAHLQTEMVLDVGWVEQRKTQRESECWVSLRQPNLQFFAIF